MPGSRTARPSPWLVEGMERVVEWCVTDMGLGGGRDVSKAGCLGCDVVPYATRERDRGIGLDAVVALMGVVCCGGDAYRTSWHEIVVFWHGA